jgi:hypothetical protein
MSLESNFCSCERGWDLSVDEITRQRKKSIPGKAYPFLQMIVLLGKEFASGPNPSFPFWLVWEL